MFFLISSDEIQLLTDARGIIYPEAKSVTGLPQIDQLLEACLFPGPYPASPGPKWGSPALGNEDSNVAAGNEQQVTPLYQYGARPLHDPNKIERLVLELRNDESSQGETNLQLYLAAFSVLERGYGGKEAAVVWIDNALRFSAARFSHILQCHLATQAPCLSFQNRESLSHAALQHVHVFRPQSSVQFIKTLKDIPNYLLDCNNHVSGNRPLGLLVIDTATAFHWQDRLDAVTAELKRNTTETQSGGSSTTDSRTGEVIACLKAIQQSFSCIILFTTIPTAKANYNPSESTQIQSNRNYTVTRLSSFASLAFVISRLPVPPFDSSMDLWECNRDQPNRLAAVSQDRFNACVDSSVGGVWGAEQNPAVASLPMKAAFSYRVSAEGIEFE